VSTSLFIIDAFVENPIYFFMAGNEPPAYQKLTPAAIKAGQQKGAPGFSPVQLEYMLKCLKSP
jgi:hypothetical protein